MIESMSPFRNRLSTKLIIAVLAFLLLLTTAVLLVVDFNLRRARANASSLSSAGLLAQGEVSLLKITTREAELSNRLLHRAAIMTQIAADYMAESQAANSLEAVVQQYPELVWRADQLARREDGTFYDPNPKRRSDIYIPSLGTSDGHTDRVLRQSAPLDLLFPTLLAQSPDAVDIFYQDTVQHITRHYPVLGFEEVFPVERTPSQQWLTEHVFDWLVLPEQNPDRHTVWSPPYVDLAGQGLLISARTPVYFGDDYRGLIGIDVSLARLAERLRNLQPTPNAYGFLIDSKGQLVATPGEKIDSLLGADVPDEETANGSALGRSLLQSEHADLRIVIAHMQAGESGSAPVDLGDEPVVIAYAPLPDVGWSLGVVAPTSDIVADAAAVAAEIERDIDDTLRATLLTIAAFSLLAMVAAVFVGRSLTQPLSSLVAGTRAITAGDLTVRLPITSRDEFGLLASSFNEMTGELRDAYQHLEQRVAARTRELTTLLEISRNVALTMDLEPLLELVLDQLKMVIDYTGASILVLEGDEYLVRAYRGPAPRETTRQARLSVDEYYSQHMLATRQPAIIDDVQADTREARLAAARDYYQTTLRYVRSYLGAPLIVRERMIGILNLHHSEPGHFNTEHAELVMAFANQAAVAIQNARLFDTVQRRADQFRAISELGRRITSILDIDELLTQAVHLIQDTFGYYHVHIGLIEGDTVILPAAAGVWEDEPTCSYCTTLDLRLGQEAICSIVVSTGQTFTVPDIGREPRYLHPKGATGSGAVVPLKVKGQVIGLLDVESKQVNAFDESDVAVLQLLANQVAVAIENARLYEQAQSLLEVSRSLTRTLELEPLLGLVLDQLKAVVDYTGASILTLESEVLVVQERRGPVLNEVRRRHQFSVSSEIDQVIIFKRQPIIIADIRDDTPSARTFRETAGNRLDVYPHIRSWMGIPLVAREGVVGMLAFDHAVPGFYTPRHAELAMAFANQAALTIENARLFHTVQRRAEQFRVVGELGRRITSILAINELLVQTARSIRDSFGYYHVHIGFIEGDEVVYKTGAASDDPQFQLCESTRLKVGQEGFVGWVAATGEPLLVPDSAQDPRNVAVKGDPTRSELVLPLKIKGQVMGVLDIESDQLNAFDELDVTVLQSLASQVAVAIENARLFQAEQRRAEQFRAIGEMGNRITSLTDLDRLLAEVAHLIHGSFSDYHSVGIGLVEGDDLVYQAGAGPLWDDPKLNFPPKRLKVGQEGLTGWVAATGEPFLARDVSQEPRYFDRVGSGTRSELVLPIKAQGTVVGVFDIQSKHLNAFDDTDLIVLQSLADQVGVAMQNAHLFAAERRRSEQLDAINEVGRRITSILDVDKLLSQTVHMIHNTFGYYHAHIGLIEAGFVVFSAAAGVWRDEPQCDKCGLLRFRVGQDGISGHVAATGKSLLVPNINQDGRYVPMENGQAGSALALPLKVRGQVIGVLNVESDDVDAFDESDMSVLQSLASQVAVAIENARLYREAGQVAALQERQRLARELHDSVSQALYGIALGTRTAVSLLEREDMEAQQADSLRQPLDYVMSLAEAGLAEMRALIFELRPESLEMEGLVAALSRQTDALRARHGLEVFTTFGREPEASLPVKEALYRVAQEALHNVVKHAQASRVEVKLATNGGRITLEIKDNGRGFNVHGSFPGHLGLRSMQERIDGIGGTFQVVSEPDQGTCILVMVGI